MGLEWRSLKPCVRSASGWKYRDAVLLLISAIKINFGAVAVPDLGP